MSPVGHKVGGIAGMRVTGEESVAVLCACVIILSIVSAGGALEVAVIVRATVCVLVVNERGCFFVSVVVVCEASRAS